MSAESLMNQTGTVYQRLNPKSTTRGGLGNATLDPSAVATTKGRMKRLSARDQRMWESINIVAEYEWITYSEVIETGMVLEVVDQFGRNYGVFQVVGGAFPYVGEGTLKSQFNYPLKRTSKTGLTS